jgi:hypothetical protein
MATLLKVKEQSIKSATARGHKMGSFAKHPRYGHMAHCSKCFYSVRINEYKVPYGKAIENDCLFD